ncbi:hypothetical protein Ddye_008794 [Dipteronia dyeriana]|uniref:Reverse transcriptase domain-containing protein n=1 Tax=Dipteronia dyeriana TaxID=168575 RepID=A0AAD9XAI7_9ROSI|nr:hypothetical protein Ddye_008794 [Dipteronia dyeriana]
MGVLLLSSKWKEALSPFLFNIAIKGLNYLIRKAAGLGLVRGATFGDDIVHRTQLQFTDDIIMFLKPMMEYLYNSRRLLRCFELAASMRINFHKPCLVNIVYGRASNVDWANIFHCRQAALPITFLGLSLGARSSLKAIWDPVLKRNENRMAPWKRKFLNKDGKLILIKTVLFSISTY